jgi:hypothetical protein
MPAEQRAELVHRQLQKQQELLEAAVHRATVAKLEVARLNKKVVQLQGELNASEGEAGRLRAQLRQQEVAAAKAEAAWRKRFKLKEAQLEDALSAQAALGAS